MRWLFIWLPIRLLSKRVGRKSWIASPYHFDAVVKAISEIRKMHPQVLASWEKTPLIICDIRFGENVSLISFSPPFDGKIVCILSDRGSSDGVIKRKIERVLRKQ